MLSKPLSEAHVAVFTGAGISAPSGLATYRGANGLYSTGGMPPLYAVNAQPHRVQELWGTIYNLVSAARESVPSAAHVALAELESRAAKVSVVTQNVDGFHTAAGSSNVVELHGSFRRMRCLKKRCSHVMETPELVMFAGDVEVPTCEKCGFLMRPDVVLFNEQLSKKDVKSAAFSLRWADLVLVVGSSLQVYPAAEFVSNGLRAGNKGVWFDLDPSSMLADTEPYDRVEYAKMDMVAGDCSVTLPEFLATLT